MKGAVVAKPGFSLSPEANEKLFEILGKMGVVFVSPDMGGEYFLSRLNLIPQTKVVSVGSIEEKCYPLRFDEFISKAAQAGAEVVVTVGGDGIASYTATAIIRQKASDSLSLLGFPAGTANVGPIVQANPSGASLLKKVGLDAIEVSCAGKVLGYGFNDVIIGRTFLGTLDGKWVNLNARAMALKGEAVQDDMKDSCVVDPGFKIIMNGKEMSLARADASIKQVCISTLHQDNLYGRAVFGGLSEAYGFKHPAALALLDKVSNDARPETWGRKELRTTVQLCFDETDLIKLDGLSKDACVIIDGNPFVLEVGSVDLRCVPNAVMAYGNWR